MLVPAVHYVQSQRHRRRLSVDLNSLAARYDALIMPSTPTPAPRDLNTTGDPVFQRPWTSAGLPTVSLPSGLSDSGLPLGVQLAGTRFGEPKLLAVARWCERVIGFDLEPPL
jgi:amidase